MDFKVDLLGPRRRRAIVLMGAALATIVAVSVTYLRPTATEAPVVVNAAGPTLMQPQRVIILNPGTDVYFTWHVVVPGGSGGHRAG